MSKEKFLEQVKNGKFDMGKMTKSQAKVLIDNIEDMDFFEQFHANIIGFEGGSYFRSNCLYYAFQKNPSAFKKMSEEQIFNAIEILNECSGFSDEYFDYLPKKIRNNRNKFLEILKNAKTKLAVSYIPKRYVKDREIILEAAKKGYPAFCLEPQFLADEDIMYEIGKRNLKVFEYVSKKLLTTEFVTKVIEKNPLAIAHAPNKFKRDKEIMRKVVEQSPHSLVFGLELTKDVDYVLDLAKNNPEVFTYASQEVRSNPEAVNRMAEIDPKVAINAVPDDVILNDDFVAQLNFKDDKELQKELEHQQAEIKAERVKSF